MFKYSLNILNYRMIRMQYVIQILIRNASFGRFHKIDFSRYRGSQQDTAQIIAEFKLSSTS